MKDINLLVVEDDVFQRQLIVRLLRSLSIMRLTEAGDGQQALAALQAAGDAPFDVVLCDLNMPGMDGLEFLRHLSQGSQQPMVMIISGLDPRMLASADRMAKTYGVRLLGTLQKPVTLNALRDLLGKSTPAPKKWSVQPGAPTYTLDAILQGIADDQFEPFFQPKVDFHSGRITGAEALARWQHPSSGVVAPYAFIPLLEQQRQIDSLTFDMLRKSAQACRRLHAAGHVVTISVNLSLVSLADTALADNIIRMVKEQGVDPHYIVLEITESAAMTDAGHALENLIRLGMNGFVLSIDDYGTGYSSLQQLTRIAFGELKIDQSFVTEAASSEALRIVVASSIEMAHKLQVKSVAEGVETQQDWDMLQSMGCDTAQGYFISKPLPFDTFAAFMANFKVERLQASVTLASSYLTMKLLVIDDDDLTRRIIVRVLRDLGFVHVTDLAQAQAALPLFEQQPCDLILTDVEMPGMSGLELARRIRSGETQARPDTRIVVLTGHSSTESLAVALALDVNGFLVKPIVPALLEEKISRALTEKFTPRSPLGYRAVNTGLQQAAVQPTQPAAKQAASILKSEATAAAADCSDSISVSITQLRAGMVLCEDVRSRDGTLLMKMGQQLTELNINRINDLAGLLQQTRLAVKPAQVGKVATA